MSAIIHHGDPRSLPSDSLMPKIKTENLVDISLPDDYLNDIPQDLSRRSNDNTSKGSYSGTSEKQTGDNFHHSKHALPTLTGDGRPQSDEESRDNESSVGSQMTTDGSNGHANGGNGLTQEHARTYDVYETNNKASMSMQSYDMLGAITEEFQPIRDHDGNYVLEVDCGSNSGLLYINKLCQGSKGQSIYFSGTWLTPNEFQYISGRETAKDWKRSIRHRGKSLKILMSRGLLSVHTSAASECSKCKTNMAMSRARYSTEKKSIPSNSLLTVPSSTTMFTVLDKQRSSVGDTDSTSLNQIIHQLHQTNGFTSDASKKRPALLLEMSGTDNKRPRSESPMEDDIYEEQQRRIFQAANSPEPHMIENVARSLNISTGGSGPPPPSSLSPPSLEDQVNRVAPDNGDFILRSPQSLTKHQNKSSWKQISPQHIDLANTDRESSRSPHLLFSRSTGTLSGSNTYHKQTVMRQRCHSQGYNLSSRTSSTNITTSDTSRRTQSLLTPTTKSSDTPMIELTRPDLAPSNGSVAIRSRAGDVTSANQVADDGPATSGQLSADAVFFPSDMSSWMVDDVVQFVQSLKGCEEYAQLFREQAIDGEILPVLTEDHLLQNMGMKLGPALKIRLHIAKRLGFTLTGQYCTLKTPYEEIH